MEKQNDTFPVVGNNNATNMTFYEPDEEEMEHAVLVFYLVMAVMIGAQSLLVSWRKRSRRSYELVTLLGLWIIPPIFCIQLGFYYFLTVGFPSFLFFLFQSLLQVCVAICRCGHFIAVSLDT